jgi:hypothetical protein
MNALFAIGPIVAVIGVVSIFFVLRHKSVQTRSMYSSRRSNMERKVRAARTRTLGPEKHVEKAPGGPAVHEAAKLTYEPSAFQGPPVAPPSAPMAAPNQSWDVGPTVPPPSTIAPPPAPPYVPAPEPPPPSEREPIWTPTPPEPAPASQTSPPRPAHVEVPAGAGASWSIVGAEAKEEAISGDGKKKKKGKRGAEESAWQLASGEAPGDESEDEVRGPGTAMAVAQYVVIIVGLLAVLAGIVLMFVTSKGT